ncbi:UDP-N-acetylglucosamine--N-acetylmuramyl-(pentapeptide) pyrophosphoryl-undecaprenol N-acetylglucosamine transferase [Treponema sp. HNW]|uniref:UDP-N-acetylglucosamine--N-acetylmuramyl- (pentapeptide) pyrophosphoryl-undecaprenol N-acetylglucosamine transferase n=1 Tax=Treponema sp. HNW TaxID=3116654 RepID=UPI003D11AEFB
MKKIVKTVVCTGGGTGGHIYPGLAVADELKERDPSVRIIWFGSSSGRDRDMVEANRNRRGLPSVDGFVGIPSGKLRRYFSLQNLFDLFKIAAGFFTALFYLKRIKPLAVFSKGGFVSVPPCAAAKVLGIPVYTHECDFSPGLATRLNSRFAACILLSYEQSKRFFPEKLQSSLLVTGNPVRPVFYDADAAQGRAFLDLKDAESEKPLLLVLGGSSGARQINDLIFKNFDWLCEHFIVVHQTGKGSDYERAVSAEFEAARLRKRYLPYDFIYAQMPHLIAACDIVFSRAGANSLWECAVCAKPMLLLPLAGAGTRGDQVENAAWFVNQGAALLLEAQSASSAAGGLQPDALSAALKSHLTQMKDAGFRSDMGKSALKAAGGEKSARKIADILYTGVLAQHDI